MARLSVYLESEKNPLFILLRKHLKDSQRYLFRDNRFSLTLQQQEFCNHLSPKINLYILSGFPEHRVQLMRLYQSQQKSQKGKGGFKISERRMLCGCVSEHPEIKINLEQDAKWWKTFNLSTLLLLISSALKHQH